MTAPTEPTGTPPSERRSLTEIAVDVLVAVGRWRRRRTHHQSVKFANAGPPSVLRPSDISECVPAKSPPRATKLADIAAFHDANPNISAELESAWLWTLALDAVVESEVRPQIKGIKAITYGFVQSGSTVRLAVIFYVRVRALVQAAPLFIAIGENKFPIVIRPPFVDLSAHADVKFRFGEITCDARIGNDYGILTAAHVVAKENKNLNPSIRAQDMVTCSRAGTSSACEHRVLATDTVMDATLVNAEVARENPKIIQAMKYVGHFPITIETPKGPIDSIICEVGGVPQGIIPGTRGKIPAAPALLFSVTAGKHGWSGAMVTENITGKPYCMFQGSREVYKGKLGRLQMLRQLEVVWGMEILERHVT